MFFTAAEEQQQQTNLWSHDPELGTADLSRINLGRGHNRPPLLELTASAQFSKNGPPVTSK